MDTRFEIAQSLRRLEFHSGRAMAKFLACLFVAWMAAFAPEHEGLSEAARWSLSIVVLGAGLWMTEAIPAFAVSLLVIGLQILVLGRPGGVLLDAEDAQGWEMFVNPWASPPMWLFFGGLVLARAAERTGVDRHLAQRVMRATGGRPHILLPALMALSFVLSMFMSNTATTALLLVMLRPAMASLPLDSSVARALLLGLAIGANLGGMGTVIGSPPNAIAAGLLEQDSPVNFLEWIVLGLPPALLLFGLAWLTLWRLIGRTTDTLPFEMPSSAHASRQVMRWQRLATLAVFVLTIVLWMSGSWHGIPTAVVSFVPIVSLSMIGVIGREEFKSIDWDVLILLAGGLSLGVGIEVSGLANWLAQSVQSMPMSPWIAALLLSWLAALVSNLMSNTAAANILLPVTLIIAEAMEQEASIFVIPVALGCSVAMALPISTPPNSLIYASGRLRGSDYLPVGISMFVIGPPIALAWVWLMR